MQAEELKPTRNLVIPTEVFRELIYALGHAVDVAETRPIPDLEQRVGYLTLALHGQDLDWLVGSSKTAGVLETTSQLGMGYYRLGGQQELNMNGIGVAGQTTGTKPYNSGEEGVSFEIGRLTGYGEVFWVMPAAHALQGGGLISIFDSLHDPELGNPIGGLHRFTGEMDVYSPFALVLTRLSRLNEMSSDITGLVQLFRRDKQSFMRKFAETGVLNTVEVDEVTEEFLEDLISNQYEKFRELMIATHSYWGVNLNSPLVLLMIPEKWEDQIRDIINETELNDKQKEFINNQIVLYRADLDQDEDISELEKIYITLQEPSEYARRILPNLRLFLGRPELTLQEAESVLKLSETLLQKDRITNVPFLGNVVAPSVSLI